MFFQLLLVILPPPPQRFCLRDFESNHSWKGRAELSQSKEPWCLSRVSVQGAVSDLGDARDSTGCVLTKPWEQGRQQCPCSVHLKDL